MQCTAAPTSPSRRGARPRAALPADPWATGPSLFPLKGGEGHLPLILLSHGRT
jgi:hypothetical protein